MSYAVKEIFYTLQGEGSHTGRPAVFCRFAGCNLWSGREAQRAHAICRFCDTDFVGTDGPGGGRFATADDLARAITSTWQGATHPRSRPFVVCTGGEPLLQLDRPAVKALHAAGFEIAKTLPSAGSGYSQWTGQPARRTPGPRSPTAWPTRSGS